MYLKEANCHTLRRADLSLYISGHCGKRPGSFRHRSGDTHQATNAHRSDGARTDCELRFYTDKDEIITRYSIKGRTSQCAPSLNSWGGLRKKSLF